MKIDRATFLALAASLTAACASSSTPEDLASGTDNLNGERPPGSMRATQEDDTEDCWSPVEEGSGRDVRRAFVADLGLDPVNDFPAAEGFCNSFATTAEGFDVRLYGRCEAIAEYYVPWVAFNGFAAMKSRLRATKVERDDALLSFEGRIARDRIDSGRGVCKTASAKSACASIDTPRRDACMKALSQVQPRHQARLTGCLSRDQEMSVASCVEGIGLR